MQGLEPPSASVRFFCSELGKTKKIVSHRLIQSSLQKKRKKPDAGSFPCKAEELRLILPSSKYDEPAPAETDILPPHVKEGEYHSTVTLRGLYMCCGQWGPTSKSRMMPVRGVAGAAGAGPGAAEEEEAWRWTFFCGVSQAVEYADAHWDKCRGDKVIWFNVARLE